MWEMPAQHGEHRVLLHVIEPELGVDLRAPVIGEEPIALQRREAIRMNTRNAVSLKPKPAGSGSA
jgi:hypothetical protein